MTEEQKKADKKIEKLIDKKLQEINALIMQSNNPNLIDLGKILSTIGMCLKIDISLFATLFQRIEPLVDAIIATSIKVQMKMDNMTEDEVKSEMIERAKTYWGKLNPEEREGMIQKVMQLRGVDYDSAKKIAKEPWKYMNEKDSGVPIQTRNTDLNLN